MTADRSHPTMTTRALSVDRLVAIFKEHHLPLMNPEVIAEKILADPRLSATYDEPEVKLPQVLPAPEAPNFGFWYARVINDKTVTHTEYFDNLAALESREHDILLGGWHTVRYELVPRKYPEDSDEYRMIIGSYKHADMHKKVDNS